jgi:transcriptional regulator with XRE-family HTH domain
MKTTTYAKLLRYLRTERGFSQIIVAKQLGLSRASYLGLEHGSRELSLSEALKVTTLYGIRIDDLIHNHKPDFEKYKMMVLALLRAAKEESVTLKKTKLSLLLYLADMRNYYETKESMSGMTYRKYSYGPACDAFHRVVDEMERDGALTITQILRDDYHMYEIKESRGSARTKLQHLTQKEINRLHELCQAWGSTATTELQQFVMAGRPVSETESGSDIEYALITKEEPHLVS